MKSRLPFLNGARFTSRPAALDFERIMGFQIGGSQAHYFKAYRTI